MCNDQQPLDIDERIIARFNADQRHLYSLEGNVNCLGGRLTNVETAIERSRAQDLLQRLDSNTRRLDDLQASLVDLENQVQILNDKLKP